MDKDNSGMLQIAFKSDFNDRKQYLNFAAEVERPISFILYPLK